MLLAASCAVVFAAVYAVGVRTSAPIVKTVQAGDVFADRPVPAAVTAASPPAFAKAEAPSPPATPEAIEPEVEVLAGALAEAPLPDGEEPVDEALSRMAAKPTSDTVPSLLEVARSDPDARNRLLAVTGLRRAGFRGNGAAADALREISNSSDVELAPVARFAVIQIENRHARRSGAR